MTKEDQKSKGQRAKEPHSNDDVHARRGSLELVSSEYLFLLEGTPKATAAGSAIAEQRVVRIYRWTINQLG